MINPVRLQQIHEILDSARVSFIGFIKVAQEKAVPCFNILIVSFYREEFRILKGIFPINLFDQRL